jgi:F-type H+-transporting ATPase subunit gamma
MESGDLLLRKIRSAESLQGVVKNLKTMAAVSIGPYERAVVALSDYYRTVELALIACLRRYELPASANHDHKEAKPPLKQTGVIVFGSDQGMVGQFNDHLAEFVLQELQAMGGSKRVWPIGERIYVRLIGAGLEVERPAPTPDTVGGITPLIGRLLSAVEARRGADGLDRVLICHNRPKPGAGYEPICQQLLPLDAAWTSELQTRRWPARPLPQVRQQPQETFAAALREYLFVSLFRACAESLASENAARLASMQGAEENIDRLLDQLRTAYNQDRQESIDAELFEVLFGFEAILQPGNAVR